MHDNALEGLQGLGDLQGTQGHQGLLQGEEEVSKEQKQFTVRKPAYWAARRPGLARR